MESNRFLEMNDYLASGTKGRCGKGGDRLAAAAPGMASMQSSWARSLAATDRVLVILIENGGIDLGIPSLVDKILSAVPGAGNLISDDQKQKLVGKIREKLKSVTDNLLESAELSVNRYTSAKPGQFSDVVVLRDGTASYQDLKRTLIGLTRAGKIVDVIILTHGSTDYISVTDGIDGRKIRDMKAENGKPLSIRSVYMMNCVGSSLNQAWIDAGAKVSSGALKNNYLPEPTTYFFWKNWKEGQSFENAATSAYRKTINLMNETAQAIVAALPIPGAGLLASQIDFENLDFVKDSAPVIQGQRTVTINSDELSFTESNYCSLATTVLPVNLLMSLSDAPSAGESVSPQAINFIKSWELFHSTIYNDNSGHRMIGYGTRLHKDDSDAAQAQQYANGITQDEATNLLSRKVGEIQKHIAACVTVPLNRNQTDALVSFVYNIGGRQFKKSTLLQLLNQGNYSAVPAELRKWTKAVQDRVMVDLPELVKRRNAEADLFQRAVTSNTAIAESMTTYSVPFYDTGEHVLTGGSNFTDQLHVGKGAGVPFSYGQIIAMAGDLFGTVDQLMNADPTELLRLKAMLERDTQFYRSNVASRLVDRSGGVSDDAWDKATNKRYLKLAEDNFEHFSPVLLFKGASFASVPNRMGDNKSAWERHHKQAIEAAQKMFLAPENANRSFFPEWPLIINAFGDHFLTDAFAAGHLINKETVIRLFKANFFNGGSLKPDGKKFLEKLADQSFTGDVKAKFSKLETADFTWWKGVVPVGHPNINTADRFAQVLISVAEQKPDEIGNVTVKALHDKLNEDGAEVTNSAGDGTWTLTGDGFLNARNLNIIQKAVQQSIDDISDPSIYKSNLNFGAYFAKVWSHVPQMTPATQKKIEQLIIEYTNPNSAPLIAAAAVIITKKADLLIAKLIEAKALRPA